MFPSLCFNIGWAASRWHTERRHCGTARAMFHGTMVQRPDRAAKQGCRFGRSGSGTPQIHVCTFCILRAGVLWPKVRCAEALAALDRGPFGCYMACNKMGPMAPGQEAVRPAFDDIAQGKSYVLCPLSSALARAILVASTLVQTSVVASIIPRHQQSLETFVMD